MNQYNVTGIVDDTIGENIQLQNTPSKLETYVAEQINKYDVNCFSNNYDVQWNNDMWNGVSACTANNVCFSDIVPSQQDNDNNKYDKYDNNIRKCRSESPRLMMKEDVKSSTKHNFVYINDDYLDNSNELEGIILNDNYSEISEFSNTLYGQEQEQEQEQKQIYDYKCGHKHRYRHKQEQEQEQRQEQEQEQYKEFINRRNSNSNITNIIDQIRNSNNTISPFTNVTYHTGAFDSLFRIISIIISIIIIVVLAWMIYDRT